MNIFNPKTLLFASLLLVVGCTSNEEQAPVKEKPLSVHPVKKIVEETIITHSEYPATIEGIQIVELRPRISGYLENIFVDEGQKVTKGQRLFKINSAEYIQQVNSAEANVAVAEAQISSARLEIEKQRPLVEKGIVGEYSLKAAELGLVSAQASLKQANAVLENARINLDFSYIYSPANGTVGIIPYRIGSLVSPTVVEPLTIISDVSKVRAYFSINEKDVLNFKQNGVKSDTKNVQFILANGDAFDQIGAIDAVSGNIDKSTGSTTIRATFKNPKNLLENGSSGTIKIPTTIENAITIPQSATFEIQNKRFAYKLNEDDTVSPIDIDIVADDKGQYFIVTRGISLGDRIVVDGINALKADLKIIPEEAL